MPIRITGMSSNLDTEAIIRELVNVQKTKVDTIKKEQTKLQWKQDAWKELNTKISKFYNGVLSDMRYQGTYTKKASKVSNSNAISVTTGGNAVNGVQSLTVERLAKSGHMTGAKLATKVNGNSKLSKLGVTDSSTMTVKVGSSEKTIDLNKDMTINDVVAKLNESGVTASYDETNQRFFIHSKSVGAKGDFELSFSDKNTQFMLGLNTKMSDSDLDAYLASYDYTQDNINDTANLWAQEIVTANQQIDDSIAQFERDIQDLVDATSYDRSRTSDIIKQEIEALGDGDEDKLKTLKAELATAQQVETFQEQIDKLKDAKTENETYLEDGNASELLKTKVEEQYAAKRAYAESMVDAYKGVNGSTNYATEIDGQDALIKLNGADFTSANNVFKIDGLTITALQVTNGEEVTITTAQDTDGIYDTVKNFLKEYNELINELDKLYNADSAKGYEPLTDEEKDEMSETEVKKWEEKVKDSILRRDGTVDDISSTLKEVMMQGINVNGKTYYLHNFGIETLGYFSASNNEKNAYHIDGDPDDESTKNKQDKLTDAITYAPEITVDFFTQLTKNIWGKINEQMSKTEHSSAFTVYEDVKMKEDYDAYTEKIKKQENKVTKMEDKWYAKFAAMETALARLQSNQSAISSLLGGL